MSRSVVIFCSSSNQIAPIYFSEMDALARALVREKIRIVYGGGKPGLMGRLADTALSLGGEVVGVIPKYLAEIPGVLHEGLTETIIVDNLLDRKRKMLSLAETAMACPGGIGTIDEITEVIALKQLLEHKKPILFHNFLDFWSPLLEYFQELHVRGMIRENLDDLWTVATSAEEAVQIILKT